MQNLINFSTLNKLFKSHFLRGFFITVFLSATLTACTEKKATDKKAAGVGRYGRSNPTLRRVGVLPPKV